MEHERYSPGDCVNSSKFDFNVPSPRFMNDLEKTLALLRCCGDILLAFLSICPDTAVSEGAWVRLPFAAKFLWSKFVFYPRHSLASCNCSVI